jgi:hypothetical protein
MAGQNETIALEGMLEGQGVEAHCIVQALNASPAGDGKYADYKIIAVSELLPRGVYQLAVNGQTFDVRQTDLGWIGV